MQPQVHLLVLHIVPTQILHQEKLVILDQEEVAITTIVNEKRFMVVSNSKKEV